MPTPAQAQTTTDPWEQEAAKMKGAPAQGSAPATAAGSTPAADDSWKIWQQNGAGDDGRNAVQKSFDENTQADPNEPLLKTGLKTVVGAIGGPFVHPVETLKSLSHIGSLFDPENPLYSPILQGVEDYKAGGPGYAATKLAGGAVGGLALGEIGGEALGGALKLPGRIKSVVTGDVMAPAAGSEVSPFARYNAAKRVGVNLDAADATGSPLLGNLKRINENSLFGGHLYDNLKARNTGALGDATDAFLNGLYEGDRESGGREIQGALKTNHEGLRGNAETGFNQLTEETKGSPVKGAPAVGQTAASILNTIEPLAEKYPSLAPKRTMDVLNDLTRVGAKPAPQPTGFLDAPGSEFAVPRKIARTPMDTWSDLQRLRSATHDLTTTNPDLVKSQAIAPLQRMTSTLDDAMTNASSGLTPAQEAVFRRANGDWKDMKATYDDPSSPFYHAVRSENPSTLFSGVGPKTPENALNLRGRISPFEQYADEPSPALGALRRGTVESALKPNNEGAPNFRTFGANLNRIPADYRAELFSPDQNSTLRDINLTSNALAKDFNPSGSGKLGQKVAEAAAMVPSSGLPVLQYPLAKIMTSPKVVDWMMRPNTPTGKANLFFAPAAGAAAGAQPRRKLNP